MNKKIQIEDAVILKVIRLTRAIFRVLPVSASFSLLKSIGSLVYHCSKRGTIAYRNVRMAYSDQKSRTAMKRIAKRSIQNLTLSAYDFLRIPDMDEDYIHSHFKILGMEKYASYAQQKKGFIFLTAHFGCWEQLNICASVLGYEIVALARRQKHPRSDAFLTSIRQSRGTQVITKGMPVREILRALRAGRIVGILSDQDGGRNGSFVRFFGRESSYPSGVATFAIRTGSPIFPVFIFRDKRLYHHIEVEGPLLPPNEPLSDQQAERYMMQQYSDILESKIKRCPEQWLWAHRRWKSTPDRSVVILSDGKAGHLHQSQAVFEAYKNYRLSKGFAVDRIVAKIVKVGYGSGFARNLLKTLVFLFGRRLPFKWTLLKGCLDKRSFVALDCLYADMVISCGASLSAVNYLFSSENSAKSVVLMKPGLAASLFTVILAPRHDRLNHHPNIFVTDGMLSEISEVQNREWAERFLSQYGISPNVPKIGFLVGGGTGKAEFDREIFARVLEAVAQAQARLCAQLLVTTSRRTPHWACQRLKETFGDQKNNPVLVIANESNPPGTVPALLGLSDVLIVSAESMSMVSEAVNSGKRVVVFLPFDCRYLKNKHHRLLTDWKREGLIVLADLDKMQEILIGMVNETSRPVVLPKHRNEAVLKKVFEKLG